MQNTSQVGRVLCGLSGHLYADDSQVFGFSLPSRVGQLQMRISASNDDVQSPR